MLLKKHKIIGERLFSRQYVGDTGMVYYYHACFICSLMGCSLLDYKLCTDANNIESHIKQHYPKINYYYVVKEI